MNGSNPNRRRRLLAMLLVALLTCPAQAAAPGPTLPPMMTRASLAAAEKGLAFLVKNQRADGSWVNQGAYAGYPVAMTSLAAMALMAGGSTAEDGPHARQVNKALQYILRSAKAGKTGLISGGGRSMYGHGFSMLFLAQCYGVESSAKRGEEIRQVLTRAVALTVEAQSDRGGWIYTPSGAGDEGSVTVTQLQALRACRNVGIDAPKSTVDRAVKYLKDCQNPDGGISYSYASRGRSRPAISAAAIACFYAAGAYDRGSDSVEAQTVEELIRYCTRVVNVSAYTGHYYYTHYYMAQAMYQRGGAEYHEYYPKIRDRLVRTQDSDGQWAGDGVGDVYGVSLACVILQLPYGYLPIYQR